ncbi:bifunctional 4-hydroxy-2-oxoglutarate aldolase/2-dehydro-3-deoxy-phosphogluconate aldolase [Rodentibacter caecimuris]|uniref:bifunctional 4-hydroxy-2-oxoglutarate aldolase/2-dehydro-3-deoxy-phosphogluconate aldolase n=1 Tax=Rodentibacter caecimuris TaxID=1796644 RepID=UPI0022499230|nr:bifunctional 4-hydroxy-2-oxoglutarate aldolase/2-dehydro-3-deoxy-phosphogluconate aldolase [Rodentibacter heylii]MCX2961183.1 bifunctional 4-hydroxy-2-oxoglutarate aldolase/2-dehydro-3-deoxy-phosphogluconate aldolase [Rodentibacter heylii]
MKNLTALDVLTASPIIPVITIQDLKDAVPLARALVSAGVKVLEITLRTNYSLEAIRQIKESVPNLIVGAGTVTTEEQYTQVVEVGAQFVISPGVTQSLLQKSQDYTVPFIPGVATPSELMLAAEYGLKFVKFFPAEMNGGMKALQAFSGPFAKMKFCPTGGVNEKNYLDYLALKNVLCVGGTWFVPKELIEKGDFEQIHQLAKQAIDGVKRGGE